MDVNQKYLIAVDDILVHEGRCKFNDACSFEDESICGYTNDLTGDFYWMRGDGTSVISGTGPAYDVRNEKSL